MLVLRCQERVGAYKREGRQPCSRPGEYFATYTPKYGPSGCIPHCPKDCKARHDGPRIVAFYVICGYHKRGFASPYKDTLIRIPEMLSAELAMKHIAEDTREGQNVNGTIELPEAQS